MLVTLATLRPALADFCDSFAKLTMWFVNLDDKLQVMSVIEKSNPQHRYPRLFSTKYLQQLHALHMLEEHRIESTSLLNDSLSSVVHGVDRRHVGQLLSFHDQNFTHLADFISTLLEFAKSSPRLIEDLAPAIQALSDELKNPDLVDMRPSLNDRIAMAHALWDNVEAVLSASINEHMSLLSHDGTFSVIQALTDLLKVCLQSSHERGQRLVLNYQQQYPKLSSEQCIEALVWRWRANVLTGIIKSTQMQLRVMAVTAMCTDLVSMWKQSGNSPDEPAGEFLLHVGNYLLQIGLIEYLTGPNCHPEIITESANVLGFLVATKQIRDEHIERVWLGMSSDQNPRLAEALTRVLGMIINLSDSQGLINLCQRLQALPLSNFNASFRSTWENVLRRIAQRSNIDHIALTSHPFTLCLRLLREASVPTKGSGVADLELYHTSLQKFRELLSHGLSPEIRKELYESCMEDLSADSTTTLGSICALAILLRLGGARDLENLVLHHDFVRLLVEELEKAIKNSRDAGVSSILSGQLNARRRELVGDILAEYPSYLSDELGLRLWNLLVGQQSLSLEDRMAGWQIVAAVASKASDAGHDNHFIQTAFSTYLPSLPANTFCDGMHRFISQDLLSTVDKTSDFMLDDSVQISQSAIPQLWRMILSTRDSFLAERVMRTLAVEVCLDNQLIYSYPVHRARKVHLSLVNRCLAQLRDAAQSLTTSTEESLTVEDEPMVLIASAEQVND